MRGAFLATLLESPQSPLYKQKSGSEVETVANFSAMDNVMPSHMNKHVPLPKMMVPVGKVEGKPVALQLMGRAQKTKRRRPNWQVVATRDERRGDHYFERKSVNIINMSHHDI